MYTSSQPNGKPLCIPWPWDHIRMLEVGILLWPSEDRSGRFEACGLLSAQGAPSLGVVSIVRAARCIWAWPVLQAPVGRSDLLLVPKYPHRPPSLPVPMRWGSVGHVKPDFSVCGRRPIEISPLQIQSSDPRVSQSEERAQSRQQYCDNLERCLTNTREESRISPSAFSPSR